MVLISRVSNMKTEKNSINIRKIVKIGWGAQKNFRKFKKSMKKDGKKK